VKTAVVTRIIANTPPTNGDKHYYIMLMRFFYKSYEFVPISERIQPPSILSGNGKRKINMSDRRRG
jgi:hypothetical protein